MWGPNINQVEVLDVDERSMLYGVGYKPGPGVRILRSTADGTVAEERLAEDEIYQGGFLFDGGMLYSVTSALDEAKFEIRRRLDGQNSSSTMWDAVSQGSEFSELAMVGDTLFFVRTDPGPVRCLVAVDPRVVDPVGDGYDVHCLQEGARFGWLESAGDGTLSFQTWAQGDDCATLHRLRAGESVPELVEVDGCVSRGVASSRLAAWTEEPVPDEDGSSNWFEVDVRAQVGEEVVDLGTGIAGTATWCQGGVYWNVESTRDEPAHIRRWFPGGPIEVVRSAGREPDTGFDDALQLSLRCYDDRVTFVEQTSAGELQQTFLTSPSFGWALPLPYDLDAE